MLLVVAVVSLGTLLVVQDKVDRNYQNFLGSQFQQQIQLFFEKQEARLAAARKTIEAATANVRLIAALDAGDLARFYSDLGLELSDILGEYAARKGVGPRGKAPFFRFVTADGRVLAPPDSLAGFVSGVEEVDLAEILSGLSSGLHPESQENVGYLSFRSMGREVLYEILISEIYDPASYDFLGDLIFAVPVTPADVFAGVNSESLKTGIFQDLHLHSENIPPDSRAAISELLISLSEGLEVGSPRIDIMGIPHQVFFKRVSTKSRFPPVFHVYLYSLGELRELLQEIRWTVFFVAPVALLIGLGLSLFAAHSLSKPISDLVAGTHEVQAGNYDVRVESRSRDEIGQLTQSFNAMTEGLALKERYRSVLDKVADPQVAAELMSGSMDLGGEVRDITTLFCDIRGFTPLTEGMPPADVIHMLNEHMTALTRVVYERRGVVDKFVGDEIMVLFGAPRGYGDDALNAASAAVAMIGEREKLNQQSRFQFKIGIGLASGEVVAGCMGSEDRLNYTVLGEQVNLAARLCGAAGPMEVLIDALTEERLRGLIQTEPKPDMQLKGFSSASRVYALEKVLAQA